eukprot:1152016-Pelagomonas_calceolata.AAC.3
MKGIHGASALGILFSLIDAGSVFTACITNGGQLLTEQGAPSSVPAIVLPELLDAQWPIQTLREELHLSSARESMLTFCP